MKRSFFYTLFLIIFANLGVPKPLYALRQNSGNPTYLRETSLFQKVETRIKKFKPFNKTNRTGLLADNRIYFGLILLLGGLVITLIFNSLLAWIGGLAIILGCGLLLWALIDRLK